MDLSIFPVSTAMLFSLVGAVVLSTTLLLWLKQYLGVSLYVNLIGLAMNLTAFLLVAYFLVEGPLGERLLSGGLLGLIGASLSCYGYESIKNALKFAGVIKE